MSNKNEVQCSSCGATMSRSRYCGVLVCDNDECGHHKGLVRCYCGWSLSGGDGYAELEEWGETIDTEY
ncbi:MAG: hypothetical protein ACO32I_09450 [Candidatus Limnocylindrus sp.]